MQAPSTDPLEFITGDPFSVPPARVCAVFPALVLGVGEHGARVRSRLEERLWSADPLLLSVITLASLTVGDRSLSLSAMGQSVEEPVADTPPAAVLGDRAGTIRQGLQVLSDGLGVHEHLQRLKEFGYIPFGEDADLVLRFYLVADLREDGVADLLPTLSRVLQDCREGRGETRCTVVCVLPHGDLPRPATGGAVDRVMVTSQAKQDGFLASGPEELEQAHALFLEAMLVSGTEDTLAELDMGRGMAGTFGIAALRLATDHMEAWLTARLARRVLEEGYLTPSPVPDDDRGEEVRADTHLGTLIRELSTERVTLRDDGIGPSVSLSPEAPLSRWCAGGVDGRVADSIPIVHKGDDATEKTTADTEDGTPEPQNQQPDPIPPLIAVQRALPERLDALKQQFTDDMRSWIAQDCLNSFPGSVARAETGIVQWKEMLHRRGQAIMEAERTAEDEKEAIGEWLPKELDRIALQILHTGPPLWFSLLMLATFLGFVGSIVRWVFHGPGVLVWLAALVLVVEAFLTRPLVNYYRRRMREKLLAELNAALCARLTRKARVDFCDRLEQLSAWLDGAANRLEAMKDRLVALLAECAEVGDSPSLDRDEFLEQEVLLPDQCISLLAQVSLATLLGDSEVRACPGRALYPHGQDDPLDPEDLLIDAVRHAAARQFQVLRHLTLRDAFSAGPQVVSAAVERLRARALPLFPLPSSTSPEASPASPPGIIRTNLFLRNPSEIEWSAPISERSGAPDYLRPVVHADSRSVMYLRVVSRAVTATEQEEPLAASSSL